MASVAGGVELATADGGMTVSAAGGVRALMGSGIRAEQLGGGQMMFDGACRAAREVAQFGGTSRIRSLLVWPPADLAGRFGRRLRFLHLPSVVAPKADPVERQVTCLTL